MLDFSINFSSSDAYNAPYIQDDPKPTVITYGYDRKERSWCIIVEDQYGNEYESHYLGTREGCMQWIEEIKKEYGISEVIKYKAY